MTYSLSQVEVLDKVLNSGVISHRQAKRLNVIRDKCVHGLRRAQTARTHGVGLAFVDRWKKRWLATSDQRQAWFSEANAEQRSFRSDQAFILSIVSDAARSGAPAKFDEATKNKIIAMALRKPEDEGVPIEKWSYEILAAHLVESGVVDAICSSTVSNFLKSARGESSSQHLL